MAMLFLRCDSIAVLLLELGIVFHDPTRIVTNFLRDRMPHFSDFVD
jgi:hypothetical protein